MHSTPKDSLFPLVVCSRSREYETAATQERLTLQTAAVVQPLTREQVKGYLALAGKALAGLRSALKSNPTLIDLASTPLMLQVLILTYQGTSVRDLPSKEASLRHHIWADYVQRMIDRKGDTSRYPSDQTVTWLGWLARQMHDHSQTIFHLEQLQPDWLAKRQKHFYRLSVGPVYGLVAGLVAGTPGLLIGLVSMLVTGLVAGLFVGLVVGLDLGLTFGLPAGLVAGLFFGLKAKIEPAEKLTWSWRNGKSRLVTGLIVGLFFGLLSGLIFGLGAGRRAFQDFVGQ